ncbi:MAG: M20/M25/M40 family metallo-hydrolase, partial [Dehalococcoidia bacterium]
MAAEINWQPVLDEALDIFVRYLRINTTNPPGNEKPAARFLGSIIEREGISCEYIEIQPAREALVARLPGDGSKRPLMLCNHTDVVPVEEAYWTKPAFEGLIEGGKIYGRGAVDMKGAGVMQLMTLLLLKRHDVPRKRDIVFCAVPDEEAGSVWGMQWLSEHRPDVVDVEFELSEGGTGTSQFAGKDAKLFSVATNEKDICWMKLTATGTPGHGSRPHRDNSAVHLTRALTKLADWERPISYTPETRLYLDQLSAEGLLPKSGSDSELEAIITQNPAMHAMFTNTLNITMINSGIKANVIPAKSEAVIDCRLLPGQDREDWRRQITAVIDDPRVDVSFHADWGQQQPQPVPWDTELFRTIESVMTEAIEDAVVVPATCVGGTDNRFLRQRGIPAYGFIPCLLTPEEAAGFHGNDEFLSVDNFNMGCELM